jgi:hypothetical protein
MLIPGIWVKKVLTSEASLVDKDWLIGVHNAQKKECQGSGMTKWESAGEERSMLGENNLKYSCC